MDGSNGSNGWNAERMLELATRHARVEAERRLEELMDTLVEEPVYEFLVQGLRLRGGARVRRYYRQFFDATWRALPAGSGSDSGETRRRWRARTPSKSGGPTARSFTA